MCAQRMRELKVCVREICDKCVCRQDVRACAGRVYTILCVWGEGGRRCNIIYENDTYGR